MIITRAGFYYSTLYDLHRPGHEKHEWMGQREREKKARKAWRNGPAEGHAFSMQSFMEGAVVPIVSFKDLNQWVGNMQGSYCLTNENQKILHWPSLLERGNW